MRVQVEAYAGHRGNERPLRFRLGERLIEVVEVLDRWQGETACYFRVQGDDGDTYVLKYITNQDCWELASFTRQGSRATELLQPGGKTVH